MGLRNRFSSILKAILKSTVQGFDSIMGLIVTDVMQVAINSRMPRTTGSNRNLGRLFVGCFFADCVPALSAFASYLWLREAAET